MARQYHPRKFFRQAPNKLLQQYFKSKHVFAEVRFEELTETQIEPVYEAWLQLPEGLKKETERDFREIDFMATEGGIKAIIDEADWHEEKLAESFSEMKDHHDRAFWTFLYRPHYWTQAIQFHQADNIPQSYWRKRKNCPKKPAHVEAEDIRLLEQEISRYFHRKEGRGKNCRVESYRRNDLDYFFAYPEDYAQASIEWMNDEFQRRPHNFAFELIFVYSQKEGTLDIYLPGDKKPVPELQKIFVETILNASLERDAEDEKVYNLNPLKKRGFQFVYDTKSGIEEVLIRRLRLSSMFTRKKRIILEVDPFRNPDAIYDLLDEMKGSIRLTQYNVTQVGLKVVFAPDSTYSRGKIRSFDISFPNSCSLRQDGRDLIIRKMLANSGLEPKEPENVNEG